MADLHSFSLAHGATDAGLPSVADAGPSAVADAQTQFDRASDLLAKGKHTAAADALVRLAATVPKSHLAADALFVAGGLFEEKLKQPVRAARTYKRLLDLYPDSRSAVAASRRYKELQLNLGTGTQGATAVAAWNDVLTEFPRRPVAESVGIVEALVIDHPTWPGRARALVWLATLHHRRGEWKQAARRYDEAAAAAKDPELQFEALLGAGTVAIRTGRFRDADARFSRLPYDGAPGRKRARDDAFKRLERAKLRAGLYVASFVVLGVLLLGLLFSLRRSAGSWPAAGKALWRPPVEVIYMAPVAAIFVGASFTAHYAIAPAVVIVCCGGLCVTWLSGAGLRAAGNRVARLALVHAVVSFGAVLALSYIALHRNRLIDMLIETVRFGPDV